jgi:hypothetical protein
VEFHGSYQLPGEITVSAGYGHGAAICFTGVDYNAALPGPGDFNSRKPYVALRFTTNAYNQSNQPALAIRRCNVATKRYSKGLSFTGSFTWGHSYDFGLHNAAYPWNANLDRALQDTDRKFVFVFSHVWEFHLAPARST